jgi:D-serine deaminase-like pyridoxal phosphate-dependent protein
MVDHPDQLRSVVAIHESSGIAPDVFLKIDMGAKRAGVEPLSESASTLISSLLILSSAGQAHFLGLYAHAGQSYTGSSRATALDYLRQEFESLLVTAQAVRSVSPDTALVLSGGATPTTTGIRNLLAPLSSYSEEESSAISAIRATIQTIRETNSIIEIHAGVYPTLDIQQLSTHALPTEGPDAMLGWNDLALTIVAEVASIYPKRGPNKTTEYLIAAGTLALGREPCKAYPGWGVLTPWNRPGVAMPAGLPDKFSGYNVGRISQEHGIVTWRDSGDTTLPDDGGVDSGEFEIGQKIRIWPNHACIAGAGYGWYLIVDSTIEGKEDEIVDVWVRWRGW